LIGDAGYGLAYLGLTYWLQKKKGKAVANKNIFFLGYLLSSCAIIWGALSGTFFGQEWLTTRNIKPLLPALNDPAAMQNICFLLGAIHLTVAHAWRACVKFPQQNFLADVGWIAVLWSGYFLARALILAEPFPGFGLPLALGAIALVLFFSEPRKNILKRLGAGFLSVTFGLSFMSAFTDVVSYVRLFAVGLAGVAIANTTNTIAAGLGPGIIAFLGGIFITVIGHALNLALGPIAVLVHGVRLNVLEFGVNHTNISWGGEAYRPLEEVAA
jgi:V/A-type H+-transporting ATPase subunit I